MDTEVQEESIQTETPPGTNTEGEFFAPRKAVLTEEMINKIAGILSGGNTK